MLLVGEIHTGLLQNSIALNPPTCERVLEFVLGERVRRFDRPMSHAISPDLFTGVDCRLATRTGARVRGVGTVVSHATITGGHVVQGVATVRIEPGVAGRRLPWSHYLAHPGRIEVIGRAGWDDLASGYVAPQPSPSTLDLGAICARALKEVQTSPLLDRRAPFKAARTRLRWAVLPDAGSRDGTSLRLDMQSGYLRTLLVHGTPEQAAAIADFCADLALHDWLLTMLLHLMAGSRIGTEPRDAVVAKLRPAVDHLLHLWMPGARTHESVAVFWASLERRPGLSRQWRACAERVRDQLALSTISLLRTRLEGISA